MAEQRSLSDELIELGKEYAEAGIDQFIDNEVLRRTSRDKNRHWIYWWCSIYSRQTVLTEDQKIH